MATQSTALHRFSFNKANVLWGAKVLMLALVYVVAGKIGLSISPVHQFATLVWPPTGIAIAMLLLWGEECWPGIFLGAFIINRITGAPLLVAFSIAGGNTLEAIVITRLIRGRL